MRIWKMNLYEKYFEKTKQGVKNWECRRDNKPYSIGDKIIFTNKLTGETLEKNIIDIFKTNTIYIGTSLVVLTLK